MSYKDIRRAKAIETRNKIRLLEVNPKLDDQSGIYILFRIDEENIKYAYVGQARHILTRLAQHMVGYQHIDLSLKKHGLYSKDNPNGWNILFEHCGLNALDDKEREYIKYVANKGYQLRNKTAGGQDKGKVQIDEYRPAKGYRDGLEQGRKSLAKELSHIIDKHLVVSLKPEKQNNKVSQKAYEKFNDLLKIDE